MAQQTLVAGSRQMYGTSAKIRSRFTMVDENFTEVYGGDRTAGTVTATADGLTTGLIDADDGFVTVTSANAGHQISLPAANVGKILVIKVGTTGCELISSVAADKVNNVVVGATNEAALTANNTYVLIYVAASIWIMTGYTNLGAVQTAVVPDAA